MAQNINQEAFEKFLNLLDPNKETAGLKYETIRRRLIKFFENRSCYIAEELADETMDRAIRKIHEMEKYEGDPLPYCYALAKTAFLEFTRGPKFCELPVMVAEIKDDNTDIENDIETLEEGLEKLKPEDRDLILRYYSYDKNTKGVRKEIETELNIPNIALRARIHRIKRSLIKLTGDRILNNSLTKSKTKSSSMLLPTIELIGVGRILSKLIQEPSLVHNLSSEQFEEFICDRLYAMGLEPNKIGPTMRKDGGIDILFWPRKRSAFPFLGAAQIKHHRKINIKEGPRTVRDFAGAITRQPINAGIIVTNTSFTPDAEWFARKYAALIRLRGFEDICRWLLDDFSDAAEWREIPESIELCPGVIIDIKELLK